MNAAAKLDAMRSQPLSLGLTTGSGLTLAGERRRPRTYGGGRMRGRGKKEDAKRARDFKANYYEDELTDDDSLFLTGRKYNKSGAKKRYSKLLNKISNANKKKRGLPPNFQDINLDDFMLAADGKTPLFPLKSSKKFKRGLEVTGYTSGPLKKRRKEVCAAYGLDYGRNFKQAGELMNTCNKAYSKRFLTNVGKVNPELREMLNNSLLGLQFNMSRPVEKKFLTALAESQDSVIDEKKYHRGSTSSNPWIKKIQAISMKYKLQGKQRSFKQIRQEAQREYAAERAG